MPTLVQQLRGAVAELEGSGRFRDLGLSLTRETTGEAILMAGGRWDRRARCFLEPTPDDTEFVEFSLAESQLDFIQWYAEWLCDFREGHPRDISVAMLADDRRGGKTVAGIAAVCAGCIDVPISPVTRTPIIAAIVAKSYSERFEIEDWILTRIPGGPAVGAETGFYRHQAAPEHRFRFHAGGTLRLLSADDPDTIKQGRFDLIYFNEPQKMHARSVANGVLATADLGGLAILGANPPTGNSRGQWLFDLKQEIDDEKVALAQGRLVNPLGIKYFSCPSRLNQFIDQEARRRAGRIGALIDPTIQAGDVEGEWRRPSELAAWEFDKHRHLRPPPALGAKDITREVASEQAHGEWVAVGGIDFQNKPHIVAAVARVYGDPDDPAIYFMGELVGERRQSEEQFLERFDEYAEPRGWTRSNFLWIGDASSSWQGARHDFEGEERDSFSVFREDRWEIIPSREPRPGSRNGRGSNPPVGDRLQLANERLRQDRVFIDPVECPWIAECFRKAETKREDGKRKIVGNRWAHGFDAATYLIWRLVSQIHRERATPEHARFVKPRRPQTW